MSQESKGAGRPWHKERWVWFLLGVPGTSIVLSLIMLYVAVNGRDTLVEDDYYKAGLAINESLEKDASAVRLNLSARLEVDEHQGLKLYLSGNLPDRPNILVLFFEHPTLSKQDFDIRLIPEGDHYYGLIEQPLKGRRYLTLTAVDSTWRLQTNVEFPIETINFAPKKERFSS